MIHSTVLLVGFRDESRAVRKLLAKGACVLEAPDVRRAAVHLTDGVVHLVVLCAGRGRLGRKRLIALAKKRRLLVLEVYPPLDVKQLLALLRVRPPVDAKQLLELLG